MSALATAEIAGFLIRPVIFRIGHHAGPDGYDRLADFVGRPDARVCPNPPGRAARFLLGRCFRLLVRNPAPVYYNSSHWRAEMRVGRDSWTGGRQIFHFCYGEDQFLFSARLARRRNCRLVATVHQPPGAVKLLLRSAGHFSRIDGLILVAGCQRAFWEQFLPPERLFVVPLGVDTEHYRPAARAHRPAGPAVCLTVGSWLRDFEALAEVIGRYNARHAPAHPLQFRIVGPPGQSARFANLANVTYRHGIADEELRRELQAADVLLLPLTDSTANISLLDGLACGCPVVATDVGGTREYLDESCGTLVPPGRPGEMADVIQTLLSDRAGRERRREAARVRALRFAWPEVARRVLATYARIADLPPNR